MGRQGLSLRPCRCLLFQRRRSEAHSPTSVAERYWRFLEAPGRTRLLLQLLQQTDRGRCPGAGISSGGKWCFLWVSSRAKHALFRTSRRPFENAVTHVNSTSVMWEPLLHFSLGPRPGHTKVSAVFIFPPVTFLFLVVPQES